MSAVKGRRTVYLCSIPECTKQVQRRHLCRAHGGGVRCRGSNCTKLAQSRGLCAAHGGGRRCSIINCGKLAYRKGLCFRHDGGRRCRISNCHKFAQIRGCCTSHSKLLELELSRVSCGLLPRACTSPEEFQAQQPSVPSTDLTSDSPPGEYGNDSYTQSSRSQNRHRSGSFYHSKVISPIEDHTPEASHQEIQVTRVTAVISPRVLYRPLCRRLYCQPRHIQGHLPSS